MEFCPECSSILTPQKDGKKRVLCCFNCGYKKRLTSKSKASYRIVDKIQHGPDEETVVIDEKMAQHQIMPTAKVECAKCGNREAYCWQVQTRPGDESMTTFFRCTKCNLTWREY